MATQPFTPAQLASNIAFQTAKKTKPMAQTTPAPLQSLLKPKTQQSQAQSTQYKTPEKPETGAKQSLSEFGDTIKAKYPQYADLDSEELGKKMLEKYPQYADKVEMPSVAQKIWKQIENLGSWIAQSVTSWGNLGKKGAILTVNQIRKAQWKPALTQEEIQKVEQSPLWQTLEGITNWQTPEQKKSVLWQVGYMAGWLAQWAVMWTPIKWSVGKWLWAIPWSGKLAAQFPRTTALLWWAAAGLEWQAQYTLTAEWRLPTKQEAVFGGAVWAGLSYLPNLAKDLKEIPAVRNKISDALRWSAWKSVAQWLWATKKKYKQLSDRITDEFLNKWLRGSKESLLKTAQEGTEKFWQAIDEAIEAWALDNVFVSKSLLTDVLDEAAKATKVWPAVINRSEFNIIKWLKWAINQLPDTIGWREARTLKQILDKIVYSTKGSIVTEEMSYKNILTNNIANTIRKELSQQNPDLAKLNKEFSFYKTLEDILTESIERTKPQQWWLRKAAAAIIWWQQQGITDRVLWYIATKAFLDATSSTTRNTLSGVLKAKLAKAIASWQPAVINSAVREINKQSNLWLPYYEQSSTAITPEWVMKQGATLPKQTVKAPPIIRETWFAKQPWTTKGLQVPQKVSTPTPQQKPPVIPQKTTKVPRVWGDKLWKEILEQDISNIKTKADYPERKNRQREYSRDSESPVKFTSWTRPTYKRHVDWYIGNHYEWVRNTGAGFYDIFGWFGNVPKVKLDFGAERSYYDSINNLLVTKKHSWTEFNLAVQDYLEKKTGISFDDYSKLPSAKPIVPATKEEIFINQLKTAQKYSDQAKETDYNLWVIKRNIRSIESSNRMWRRAEEELSKWRKRLDKVESAYKTKQNQFENAIANAKKLGVKTVMSLDEKWIPVVYFETPKWQVSFHAPNYWYSDFNTYDSVSELVEYLPAKVKDSVELVDNYKRSWLTNSKEIIDKLTSADFNKTPLLLKKK